jgi:hypothetical protein
VKYDNKDFAVSCSCRGFTRIGYPCRHVFCVYRVNKVERIPSPYIANRWKRDVLPRRIYCIENRYGVDNSPQSVLRSEILDLVTGFVDKFRNDTDSLSLFANRLKEFSDHVPIQDSNVDVTNNVNQSDVAEIIGQTTNVEVVVGNPDPVRFKGCGRTRRMVSSAEKSTEKRPKAPRLCHTCMELVTDHDSRNYKKRRLEDEAFDDNESD